MNTPTETNQSWAFFLAMQGTDVQEECIRYKDELKQLGKVVVFVSQGIISGSDKDFLSERINETLDEQFSRNLSRYVSAAMAEKSSQGLTAYHRWAT